MPDNPAPPFAGSLNQKIDRKIAAALATPPRTHIPSGFAARIAAEAQARFGPIPQPQPPSRFATLTARAALAMLLFAMLLFARTLPPASAVSFALQATFAAEFILVALFLARPTLTLR